MIKNRLLRLLDTEQTMTGWKLAKGMGVAVAAGAAVGTLFMRKAGKKIREEFKNSANTVTIKVRDLGKLKIERIE